MSYEGKVFSNKGSCHIYAEVIGNRCGIELGVLTSNGIDDWFRTWFRNGAV